MSWSDLVMTLLSGGILIVFRCWLELKWKTHHEKKEAKKRESDEK